MHYYDCAILPTSLLEIRVDRHRCLQSFYGEMESAEEAAVTPPASTQYAFGGTGTELKNFRRNSRKHLKTKVMKKDQGRAGSFLDVVALQKQRHPQCRLYHPLHRTPLTSASPAQGPGAPSVHLVQFPLFSCGTFSRHQYRTIIVSSSNSSSGNPSCRCTALLYWHSPIGCRRGTPAVVVAIRLSFCIFFFLPSADEPIWELLLERLLNAAAVGRLMIAAQQLAVFALCDFIRSPAVRYRVVAARSWERKCIMLNTLHFAVGALEMPLPVWWGEVMNILVGNFDVNLALRQHGNFSNL